MMCFRRMGRHGPMPLNALICQRQNLHESLSEPFSDSCPYDGTGLAVPPLDLVSEWDVKTCLVEAALLMDWPPAIATAKSGTFTRLFLIWIGRGNGNKARSSSE